MGDAEKRFTAPTWETEGGRMAGKDEERDGSRVEAEFVVGRIPLSISLPQFPYSYLNASMGRSWKPFQAAGGYRDRKNKKTRTKQFPTPQRAAEIGRDAPKWQSPGPTTEYNWSREQGKVGRDGKGGGQEKGKGDCGGGRNWPLKVE